MLIESDPAALAELRGHLESWGLVVREPDLQSVVPIRDGLTDAAAIIADFELDGSAALGSPYTGLALALRIAHIAARRIPTLMISGRFGRGAIPACSPHRIPVLFRPVPISQIRGWLALQGVLSDANAWPASSLAAS